MHLQSWCQFWRCKWSSGQLSRCCDVEASVVVSSNSNTTTGQLQHSGGGCQHQSWAATPTCGARLRDVLNSLRLISISVSHEASECQRFLDEMKSFWFGYSSWFGKIKCLCNDVYRDQRNICMNKIIWHWKWRMGVSMSCSSDPALQSACVCLTRELIAMQTTRPPRSVPWPGLTWDYRLTAKLCFN